MHLVNGRLNACSVLSKVDSLQKDDLRDGKNFLGGLCNTPYVCVRF